MKKYQSDLLGVLYEEALEDYKLGFISADEMKEWDADCLIPEVAPYSRTVKGVAKQIIEPIYAAQV
jgi:hypothetical protein